MNRYPAQKTQTLSIRIDKNIFITTPSDEPFDISDEQYTQIIALLRKQCLTFFGFAPQYEYGTTNYEKIRNFISYPFAPQFAAITKIEECGTPILSQLRTDPLCIEKLFQFVGIPCTPFMRRQFLINPTTIYIMLIMQRLGFTDYNVINSIVANYKKEFSSIWGIDITPVEMHHGIVAFTFSKDSANRFTFTLPDLNAEEFCSLFLNELGERKTCRMLDSYFSNRTAIDAGNMFVSLYKTGRITADIKKQIFHEGFTDYNHNVLVHCCELYQQESYQNRHIRNTNSTMHPLENQTFKYSKYEKKLRYETDGYSFIPAEDTNRLLDISEKMHNCVGYAYRNKALSHDCIIVYAKDYDTYQACIELRPEQNKKFTMVQCLASCNKPVTSRLKEACFAWANKYHIDASVLNEEPEQFIQPQVDTTHAEQIQKEKAVYENIRSSNYSFDSIINLNNRDMQHLISVTNKRELACALYGSQTQISTRFYQNMSATGARLLQEECTFFGSVDEKFNENCRYRIMAEAKILVEEAMLSYYY